MTISFFEPGDVPQAPDKVKIEHLQATPYPDGWRVKMELNVTPFQQRPNLEIGLFKVLDDDSQKAVANFSIVETMHPRMEFTLHIRGVDRPDGSYKLRAMLYYRDEVDVEAGNPGEIQVKDQQTIDLVIQVENDPIQTGDADHE